MNRELNRQLDTSGDHADLEVEAELKWWQSMRTLLQADPTDRAFRRGIQELWLCRPGNLRVMDNIRQNGLHTSVGDHERGDNNQWNKN